MSMSTESEESVSPKVKGAEASSNEMNTYKNLLIERIIQEKKTTIQKSLQGII